MTVLTVTQMVNIMVGFRELIGRSEKPRRSGVFG